jgi:hypothetical protein
MYACTWVLQGINPLLAAYVCCLVDVKRVQQHLCRKFQSSLVGQGLALRSTLVLVFVF